MNKFQVTLMMSTSQSNASGTKINPAYDSQQSYIPRSKRKEWVTVGLLGQLLVTDDGSCSINGYCLPNDEGIATYSETGYRVLDRISSNQILVMFK